MILEKIKELEDLIEVPNVDTNPEESIRAMKILNKIVELRGVVNKNNDIHNVSHQRELLLAFCEYHDTNSDVSYTAVQSDLIADFLKANNCG